MDDLASKLEAAGWSLIRAGRRLKKGRKWAGLDWSKGSTQLSHETGLSMATITKYRRRFAPDTLTPTTNPVWDTVDWSLLDTEIAKRIGVSRERVRQKRKALGLPSSAGTKRKRTEAKLLAAYSPDKPLAEIASKAGVDANYARILLRKEGLVWRTPEHKNHLKAKEYWGKVDWTRTNTAIACELGVHEPSVSRNRKKFAPDHLKTSPYWSRGKGA